MRSALQLCILCGMLGAAAIPSGAQCTGPTTAHGSGATLVRNGANSVQSAASTTTVGDYWFKWDAYVSATVKVGTVQIRSGNNSQGYGGTAAVSWTDLPSAVGVGTYRLDTFHRASSTCGTTTTNSRVLTIEVLRPAITTNPGGGAEVNGIWWLGGGQDPSNGFYNIVDFYAVPNYSPVETNPQWIVTQSPAKISLSCASCSVTRATSIKRSSSVADIQVKVVVGGVGGLSSNPFFFTVNYPKQIVYRGANTFGLGDGYETRFSYQTLEINNLALPRIAMNEKFLNQNPDPIPNNWPDFVDKGFPVYEVQPGNVWIDKVSMFSSIQTPNPSPPLIPNNGTIVQKADQQWRVGSATVGSGIFLLQAELRRRQGYATNALLKYIPVP